MHKNCDIPVEAYSWRQIKQCFVYSVAFEHFLVRRYVETV